MYFFARVADKARDRRQHREIPVAVDLIDVSVARVRRPMQKSLANRSVVRSGHAYGPLVQGTEDRAKETWTGGVNDSCER